MARRKRCPRCAEKVQAKASVCRFCGHEFDEPPAAAQPHTPWLPPVPPGPSHAQDTATSRPEAPVSSIAVQPADAGRERGWVTAVRWLLVVAYAALAWPLVVSDETWDELGTAGGVTVGLVVAAVWLLAVAFVWWLVLLARKRRRGFGRVLISAPVLLAAFGLAVVGGVGRELGEENERAEQAAQVVGGTGSDSEKLERRRDDYVAWFNPVVGMFEQYRAVTEPLAEVIELSDRDASPDPERVQRLFERAHRAAQALLEQARRLPDDDPELADVNNDMVRAAALLAAGCRDYVDGFANGDDAMLTEGDRKVRRGERLLRRAGAASDDVYQQLGGREAFDGRIDFDRIAELASRGP